MLRSAITRPAAAALLLTLVGSACSQSAAPMPQASPAPAPSPAAQPAPAPAAAMSPVGTYDFSTTAQGQSIAGVIVITGAPGAYGGSMATQATPELPIRTVAVRGDSVFITLDTPEGEAAVDLKLVGADITGVWSYAGMSGVLSGRKRM